MSLSNFISHKNATQGGEPHITLEDIDPARAAQYLKINKINRAPSPAHINSLSRRMELGEWSLNGDTIRFDENGFLIDGQHRLQAVIKSGVTITTFVARNMGADVFKTIDEGKVRGGADIISVAHKRHPREIAAALRLVDASKLDESWNGWFRGWESKISNKKMLDLLEEHSGIIDSAERIMQGDRKMTRKLLTASVAIFSHYWFCLIDGDDAEQFFEWLEFGEGLDRSHPVSHLRNRLVSFASKSGNRLKREKMALIFKAWNFARNGESIGLLKYSQTEKFPTPR